MSNQEKKEEALKMEKIISFSEQIKLTDKSGKDVSGDPFFVVTDRSPPLRCEGCEFLCKISEDQHSVIVKFTPQLVNFVLQNHIDLGAVLEYGANLAENALNHGKVMGIEIEDYKVDWVEPQKIPKSKI